MVSILHTSKVVTLVLGLMWLLPMTISAQHARTKIVEKEYTFVAGYKMTPDEATQVAIQRAQVEAIAETFGTVISRTTATQVSNTQGGDDAHSGVRMVSLGLSDVRGEWIETIEQSEPKISWDPDLGMIVSITIKGKIRERVTAEIDFKAVTLRNGTTERSRDNSFYAGDRLYLLFQAPTNGYLTVYLTDEEQAYCLLPYQSQYESSMPIERNKEYVFFSIDEAPYNMKEIVDEYNLTCGKEIELNRLYIIFSPNEFVKAVDKAGDGVLPRHLSMADFQRWLGKLRAHDAKVTCRALDIDINPSN